MLVLSVVEGQPVRGRGSLMALTFPGCAGMNPMRVKLRRQLARKRLLASSAVA